jgi:hypothetical protein
MRQRGYSRPYGSETEVVLRSKLQRVQADEFLKSSRVSIGVGCSDFRVGRIQWREGGEDGLG